MQRFCVLILFSKNKAGLTETEYPRRIIMLSFA